MYISKTKIKRFIIFSLILSVTISPMLLFQQSIDVKASTTIEQDRSAVTNMNKQIALKKQQIAQAEKEIAALKNNKASYATLKTKLDEKIGIIEETIDLYNEFLVLRGEEMQEIEREVAEAQAKYDSWYEYFLEMLRFAYEEGNASYIELIVKAENFVDFLTRVDIISDLVEYNKNVLESLKKSKEENLIKMAEYEKWKGETLKYQEQLKEIIQEATAEKREAVRAIAALEKEIQEKINLQNQITRDMNNTQADIQRILAEIAEKQKAAQTAPREYVGGAFAYPSDSTRGISSKYGPRVHPITGRSEFHYGIDIPGGTNIFAANDGTVIIATYNSGYGNYIVLEHGGGMTTLYAHCSKFTVSVGSTVKKGDVIAKVGSTGVSTGNHVHFEVSVNGARQNPLNYLK